MAFIGFGTLVNAISTTLGSSIGILVGNRLPDRIRNAITDVLGIFTGVIGAQSLAALAKSEFADLTGSLATVVILLALLFGTLIGSALDLEGKLDQSGGWLQKKFAKLQRGATGDQDNRSSFINGFVTSFLVWCIGPLAMLGSLNEGLGLGSEMLLLKSALDFFSAIAFASLFGFGVMAAVIPLVVYQGLITFIGWAIGDVLPTYAVDAMTIAGGVMLLGLALRILGIKNVRVSDMAPSLILAPLGAWLVTLF